MDSKTDVLCIPTHSWYPDPLRKHLITPHACVKQLFLSVCHKNYCSYIQFRGCRHS